MYKKDLGIGVHFLLFLVPKAHLLCTELPSCLNNMAGKVLTQSTKSFSLVLNLHLCCSGHNIL